MSFSRYSFVNTALIEWGGGEGICLTKILGLVNNFSSRGAAKQSPYFNHKPPQFIPYLLTSLPSKYFRNHCRLLSCCDKCDYFSSCLFVVVFLCLFRMPLIQL